MIGVVRPLRLLALLAALCGAAWFAVGIRQADSLGAAAAIVLAPGRSVGRRTLSAAEASRARAEIHQAAFLNPGEQPLILRADLAVDGDHPQAARRLLSRALASHPDDLALWVALAGASYDSPGQFRRALLAVRRLVPPLPGRRR
jgi:hypothetical protein